jgi:hypothetical protein
MMLRWILTNERAVCKVFDMKPVRTHTFKLGRYIIWQDNVLGWCDKPDKSHKLYMILQPGNTQQALATSIHEMSHAQGIPNKYLDDGYDFTEEIARLLWRLSK